MSEFSRPASGFRFKNKGMCVTSAPDALEEHKYPYLANIRSFTEDEIQSRPQLTPVTALAGTAPVLALDAATGVYKVNNNIYYNGTVIDAGYSTSGATISPFRPNQSPLAWDYIWDSLKSSKINIAGGAATVNKVGVAEPQAPVDAAVYQGYVTPLTPPAAVNFMIYGAANSGPTVATKVADTVVAVFQDPALPGGSLNEYIVQTSSTTQAYQAGQTTNIGSNGFVIRDVFQPLVSPLTVQAIYYYASAVGRCVVVPANVGQSSGYTDEDPGIFEKTIMGALKRGALIKIGTEVCMVLGTSLGPDGTVAFEISTTSTHFVGETVTTVRAFRCYESYQPNGGAPTPPTAGQAISSTNLVFGLGGAGIGGIQTHLALANPFTYAGIAYQDSDFIHLSIQVEFLNQLNELKVLLDCSTNATGAGALNNYYYFTVRPADIIAGISDLTTGLGQAAISAQNRQTDAEAAKSGNVPSSQQTVAGNNQWSDIYVPIRSLVRVGGDDTVSLLNLNAIYVQANTGGLTGFGFQTLDVVGGFSPDVTGTSQGMEYIIRPRSTLTGAKGNPSPRMRYTVNPKRELVKVILPTTYVDPQVNVWDVYRRGATVERFTLVGTVPLASGFFLDNYSDTAIINNPQIEYDNLEPFPSIGPPITGTALAVGTVLNVTFSLTNPLANGTLSQLENLLPGNLINIGQQVYTLWTRPVIIAATGSTQTWTFQLQENAGFGTGLSVILYQPALANQNLPCIWGPDADGVFFATGDPLRPGFVTRTNPNNPDAASDRNSTDLCPPTEPLQNGALIGGTSVVFSTNRAWRGYPQQGGRYNWVEIPVGRGLAAIYGICTDGHRIFYVAKDGIRATSGGESISLTDADLYPLFPHEGIAQPSNITYAGLTLHAPSYAHANSFRLATVNGFLYFDYLDSTLTYRTLVCHLATGAWSVDQYDDPISLHTATSTPIGQGGTIQQQLWAGSITGSIYNELSVPFTGGESISCIVAMREEMYGDIRATKLFGDAMVDAAMPAGMTATPMSFGLAQTPTVFPPQARLAAPSLLDLQGQLDVRALGCVFTWTDQGTTTVLYGFQLSYIVQPALTQDRFTDYDDAGTDGAKWFEGFLLEADTQSVDKILTVRNGDTLLTQTFSSNTGDNLINHGDQQIKAYSFTPPFIAHMVRFEPDEVPWKMWEVKWITQPTPEMAVIWQTQRTTHGLPGFQHAQRVLLSYNAPQPVTFTIEVDGATTSYTFPPTTGFAKVVQVLQAQKGYYFSYKLTSSAAFAVSSDGLQVKVKAWGSDGPYEDVKILGTIVGNKALV